MFVVIFLVWAAARRDCGEQAARSLGAKRRSLQGDASRAAAQREADAWALVIACDSSDPDTNFAAGVAFQRVGRLNASLTAYTAVLNAASRAMQAGKGPGNDKSAEVRAIAMWKHTAFNRGIVLRRMDRYAEAIKSYDLALAVDATIFDAWHNRGAALVLLHDAGSGASVGSALLAKALESFRRATALNGASTKSWEAQASAATRIGDISAAVEAYDGGFAALAALEEQRSAAAAGLLRRRGVALAMLNRTDEALESFDAALRCEGAEHDADTWMQKSEALRLAQRRAEATAAMRRAFEIAPQSDAAYLLRALEGDADIAIAPPAYIERLFDDYAATFDADLVEKLQYAGPAIVHAEVVTAMEAGRPALAALAKRGALRTLDLGCGTGLSGVPFRSMSKTLFGVDLSEKMLARARERVVAPRGGGVDGDLGDRAGGAVVAPATATGGVAESAPRPVYDRLMHTDGASDLALASADAPLDLVIAADVLVYIGDIDALVAAAAAALRSGGLFAFTTEALEHQPDSAGGRDDAVCSANAGDGADAGAGAGAVAACGSHASAQWTLLASGRFAHSAAYLRDVLELHGFRGEPRGVATRSGEYGGVPGWVVAAEKR